MEEEARQWMQFRLQRPVPSQAIHFGMNSSLATQVPLTGSAPTPKPSCLECDNLPIIIDEGPYFAISAYLRAFSRSPLSFRIRCPRPIDEGNAAWAGSRTAAAWYLASASPYRFSFSSLSPSSARSYAFWTSLRRAVFWRKIVSLNV